MQETEAAPKTNTRECDASSRAQAELDKAIDDAGRTALGGKPDVGRSAIQSAQQGDSEPKFRILSTNISTWGRQAEGFLRSAAVGRFQTMTLAEHHLCANSIKKFDNLLKQSPVLQQQPRKLKIRQKARQAAQA